MREDVLLEISEADVFPPSTINLDELEVPHTVKNAGKLPPPPARSVMLPDIETHASRSDLDVMAGQSFSAKLQVEETFPVGLRYIKGCDGKCVMCLQPLMRICLKCDSGELDYEDCCIVTGECGHSIHLHCAEDYRKSMDDFKNCLICRRPWKPEWIWYLATDTLWPASHRQIAAQ